MNGMQLDLFSEAARITDPVTSHQAAASVVKRAPTQRILLLATYGREAAGLTDEEAATISGVIEKRTACWWKRCSELRHAGLLADTGRTRTSMAGEQRMVCVITAAGREALRTAGML